MIYVPGFAIALFTFPGVILHTIWHQLICRLFNVPVLDVQYINLKKSASYVAHERSENSLFNIIVTFGPLILNTIVGTLLLISVSIEYGVFNMMGIIVSGGTMWANVFDFMILLLSFWLGMSILIHALPSGLDATSLINVIKNKLYKKSTGNQFLGAPYIGYTSWLGVAFAFLILLIIPRIISLLIL